jgi:hypothetical protein
MHLECIFNSWKLAKRDFTKFETNNNKKQADQSVREGFITQEVYTARNAKLDGG